MRPALAVERQRLLKFLLVGGANSLIGLLSIYFCKWAMALGDVLANLCGYAVGLLASFMLNRSWTFRHDGPLFAAFARFLLVFAGAYGVNLIVVMAAIRWVGVNPYLAQAIGILPYTALFYCGSRYIAFRPRSAARN